MKRYTTRIVLLALSFILIIASLYLVFIYVPTEREMGIVQRIFYVMVPTAWLAMLSSPIICIGSIMYLRNGQHKWDNLARSAAEAGIIFTTLTLIVGSIWARPVWGVWWTWEPRLTATLVLWFIYLAYFIVPGLAIEESRRATFAAVIGILAFVDVPIIGLSTTLWRGMHPGALIFEGGLAPSMVLTLMVGIAAFTVLYILLLMEATSIRNAESELKRIRESLD
ncbi:MAG: cytochrome c biogenesis protein [Chloroflexota bacterium]